MEIDENLVDIIQEKPPIIRVADLNRLVREVVEGSFPLVIVEGELSTWKMNPGSGHIYGSLKDESSVLEMVMWRGTAQKHGRMPPVGRLVRVRGRLSTYAGSGRSSYQLIADRIEEAGAGVLLQRLEELKQKLLAEGLFDPARKKPLPYLPRCIGLVTSPTGAVIQDMLHRLRDRCPRPVLLWPVTVQGPSAAGEVAAAVAGFNNLPESQKPDVLIVARGGGSLEDLMAFNDEVVVRAVASSTIPVISAIGHEPDVTLCDFAADYRAPTPSAAAERVVPVQREELMRLDGVAYTAGRALVQRIGRARERVEALRRVIPDPQRLLTQAQQRLDGFAERLVDTFPGQVRRAGERLVMLERLLEAHHPQAPLRRGFALVKTIDGRIVRSALDMVRDVQVVFEDGIRKGVLE